MTVQKVAEKIRRKGHRVLTHLSKNGIKVINSHNKAYYPDISVYRNVNVENIYEVETANSVNSESIKKWKLCANGCKSFFLIVPVEKLEETKELVKRHGISVKDYITYTMDD
jgi:hypothetical protein